MRNEAFTLIELLISITIVSLLLGMTLAGYAKLNQRQTLISAGQNFKNILRDAQSRASSSEIDCNVCNCTPSGQTSFSGWHVDFVNKQIYGQCGVTPTIYSTHPFGLSQDAIITPHVTPPNELVFFSNPPSSSKATICISTSQLSNSYYVVRVNESGTVTDDGGIVSACNP